MDELRRRQVRDADIRAQGGLTAPKGVSTSTLIIGGIILAALIVVLII